MKKIDFQKLKKILPRVLRNISLAEYTTFKIGGRAKYFFEAKNKKDLVEAILVAKKFKLPFFILGGGSNILVSDKGFNGLVINFQFSIFNFQKNKIVAGAGTKLGELVTASAKRGLTGLEWVAGIPGTVGGAIYGNAGAFNKSMKDVLKEVEVFNVKELRIKNYELRDCRFGYRESIFKENKNLIILSAVLELKKGRKDEIKKKINEYVNYRKKNQPLNLPSAGSIFQNTEKFSSGYLIEKCGLKGKRIGNVKISEKHANFIVNLGQGKAKDVKKLIDLIKKKVKNKFGVELEEEIQFL